MYILCCRTWLEREDVRFLIVEINPFHPVKLFIPGAFFVCVTWPLIISEAMTIALDDSAHDS